MGTHTRRPPLIVAFIGNTYGEKTTMSRKTKTEIPNDSDYLRGHASAARYAKVSPRTISEWQRRGIIPFAKIGRKCVLFRKGAIDAALARFEVAAIV